MCVSVVVHEMHVGVNDLLSYMNGRFLLRIDLYYINIYIINLCMCLDTSTYFSFCYFFY